MSQGGLYSSIFASDVSIKDGPNLDAFSRLRVSESTTIFDAQLTYDLQPLIFEQLVTGTGASITHDSVNRNAKMTFSSTTTGGRVIMQSYEHMRYQPGKSQLVLITFNFLGGVANCLKFAGYSDGINGFEFQISGTTTQIMLRSGTSGGTQTVIQSNWNLDKMDGTGTSGKILDLTKSQILVIDFQALYVGRGRVGFDIGGQIIYVHEFTHANIDIYPFFQSANLPIRVGMTNTGTVSSSIIFQCTSVISEGGVDETIGYQFVGESSSTLVAGNGTRTHALTIRPKTLFNNIINRCKISLVDVDILVTGSVPVYWELVIGQILSGITTFSDINTTYSSMEYNTSGSTSGSPSIEIDSGHVSSSATVKGSATKNLISRYPITLDAAGAVRSLGALTLLVTGLGGTSACKATIKWKEIR